MADSPHALTCEEKILQCNVVLLWMPQAKLISSQPPLVLCMSVLKNLINSWGIEQAWVFEEQASGEEKAVSATWCAYSLPASGHLLGLKLWVLPVGFLCFFKWAVVNVKWLLWLWVFRGIKNYKEKE